jgi:hypothetical protein
MLAWCRERFTECEHGVTLPKRDECGIAIGAVRF